MPAYGFAHLRSRRNHSDVIEYLERIQATLAPFAGRFVIHGPPTEVMEGDWPGTMVLTALRLPGDLPVLRTLRTVYGAEGRPVEVSVMVKAGHLYELQYEFTPEG